MKLVAKNYKDNEYHKIQASVTYTNKKVWFTQFGGVFIEDEIDGVLCHAGFLVVELQSESDQFVTVKAKLDDGEEETDYRDHMQSLGVYPSVLFYEYIKDLQISNNPNA